MKIQKDQSITIVRERLTGLFEFLKAFHDLRSPVVREIDQQIFRLWLQTIPKHPSVEFYQGQPRNVDAKETVDGEEEGVILRVTRPNITVCPPPPKILQDWLIPGWDSVGGKVEVRDNRNITIKDDITKLECFEDDKERGDSLETWRVMRGKWVTNELPAAESLKLFQTLYELYGHLEREGERVELLVGDGILCCHDKESGDFRHPVLLQRLELEFRPEKKYPQFVLRRKEQPPELCMDFLRVLPEVDTRQLVRCAEELKQLELDPLGAEDTEGFLRRLIQGLFPKGGRFRETHQMSLDGQPSIERNPVLFLRQRRTGIGHAFDLVLDDVAHRLEVGEVFSGAVMQILGIIEADSTKADEVSSQTKIFGNEDEHILLSLPANHEQLQFAQLL